ncbi:hypothetical protein CGZ95_08905 [Enemella evansiae]|uniref:hypothetical protein n=1 Tax=Enemella evansiae TaxID=2016499 RepID=UPI000B96390D|nr:hypothetical protein [Enemella evansiae]OYO00731.1 hypothetical protein CGZ95_08905 [Enemella evansiae]
MGKFIAYAAALLVLAAGIFIGGIMVGGAWGSGMAAESAVDEVTKCMANAKDSSVDEYRGELARCLDEAKQAS